MEASPIQNVSCMKKSLHENFMYENFIFVDEKF